MRSVSHKQAAQAKVGALLGENQDRQTGTGILSYTLEATSQTKVMNFRLGTSSVPTTSGSLVLSIQNPTLGSMYACTVLSTDMQDASSVFYTEPMYLEAGDIFKAEWANADGVEWGISTVYADLGGN